MRLNIIFIGTFIFLELIFGLTQAQSVYAESCQGCMVHCTPVLFCPNPAQPDNCTTEQSCWDGCNGCEPTGCGPHEYECNRPGGCCDVGDPTPPPGGGGQGGCTSGYAATGGCCDGKGGVCVIPPINGIGGYCDDEGKNCKSTICCSEKATMYPKCGEKHYKCEGGWLATNSNLRGEGNSGWVWVCDGWYPPPVTCYEDRCPSGYKAVITAPDSWCGATRGYPLCQICDFPSWITWNGDYFLCRHMACEPICDANAWGSWSTCDGTSSTQTRTNACGTVESLACPQVGWWQVGDADIASNGDVSSRVPNDIKFSLDGLGGYPGIVAYAGNATFKFGGGGTDTFSSKNWLANTALNFSKIYDSKYFLNQIPGDTLITTVGSSVVDGSYFETEGVPSHGYYWYKYDGTTSGLDLTISSTVNLGTRRVVLLVENANLNVNANINVTKGQGFFMAIVGKDVSGANGGINISSTVGGSTPDIEGIYLADGVVKTGTGGASSDSKLHVRGSVAGYGGVILERDLGPTVNATTPGEYFEYAPDQIMLFPSVLGVRRMDWKEVAP